MCKKLNLEANKFIRGQVWFVREDPSVTKALRDTGSRVINGDRPYFVININGSMITCCPLTTNTATSDMLSNDIVFKHMNNTGGGYSESRIIISQIQTKNASKFEKYLYTFDDDSVREIMTSVCTQLGLSRDFRSSAEKRETERTAYIEEFKRSERLYSDAIKAMRKFPIQAFTEDDYKKLEIRLKGKLGKTETLFRTREEAAAFLDKWGDKSGKEISEYFDISLDRAYKWKYRAKAKVTRHG